MGHAAVLPAFEIDQVPDARSSVDSGSATSSGLEIAHASGALRGSQLEDRRKARNLPNLLHNSYTGVLALFYDNKISAL
jgi:hypothetical protein